MYAITYGWIHKLTYSKIPETATADPMVVDTPSAVAVPPPSKPDSEAAKPSKV